MSKYYVRLNQRDFIRGEKEINYLPVYFVGVILLVGGIFAFGKNLLIRHFVASSTVYAESTSSTEESANQSTQNATPISTQDAALLDTLSDKESARSALLAYLPPKIKIDEIKGGDPNLYDEIQKAIQRGEIKNYNGYLNTSEFVDMGLDQLYDKNGKVLAASTSTGADNPSIPGYKPVFNTPVGGYHENVYEVVDRDENKNPLNCIVKADPQVTSCQPPMYTTSWVVYDSVYRDPYNPSICRKARMVWNQEGSDIAQQEMYSRLPPNQNPEVINYDTLTSRTVETLTTTQCNGQGKVPPFDVIGNVYSIEHRGHSATRDAGYERRARLVDPKILGDDKTGLYVDRETDAPLFPLTGDSEANTVVGASYPTSPSPIDLKAKHRSLLAWILGKYVGSSIFSCLLEATGYKYFCSTSSSDAGNSVEVLDEHQGVLMFVDMYNAMRNPRSTEPIYREDDGVKYEYGYAQCHGDKEFTSAYEPGGEIRQMTRLQQYKFTGDPYKVRQLPVAGTIQRDIAFREGSYIPLEEDDSAYTQYESLFTNIYDDPVVPCEQNL